VADQASVTSFRLDKYKVTQGRFRQFVKALYPDGGAPADDGGLAWVPDAGSGKHAHLNAGQGLINSGSTGGYEPGWVASNDGALAPTNGNLVCDPSYATWTNLPSSRENLPINCVDWAESYAFCIWDGGFLPSEAEWEYAAAGGDQQREYPWGAATPGTVCPGTGCAYAIYGCEYPSGTADCANVSNMAPVGTSTLGTGRWGQLDLAGNVQEFALDVFVSSYFPCTDCAYLTAAPCPNDSAIQCRVIRSASFREDATDLLPPVRNYDGPATGRSVDVGFRCARGP
jgi:formylglycine-generating enzyme required for sulfatase activity